MLPKQIFLELFPLRRWLQYFAADLILQTISAKFPQIIPYFRMMCCQDLNGLTVAFESQSQYYTTMNHSPTHRSPMFGARMFCIADNNLPRSIKNCINYLWTKITCQSNHMYRIWAELKRMTLPCPFLYIFSVQLYQVFLKCSHFLASVWMCIHSGRMDAYYTLSEAVTAALSDEAKHL